MLKKCSKTLALIKRSISVQSSLPKNFFSSSYQLDPKVCNSLKSNDFLLHRHIGPNEVELEQMLSAVNAKSLEDLLEQVIPRPIYDPNALKYVNFEVPPTKSESEFLSDFRTLAKKNQINKNYIGCGYYGTITPPVIQRNLLENPCWYTSYTPYQAEVSQGRLESLLNYQTMISELTGMEFANASLLDEATAAAEAMAMSYSISNQKKTKFFVSQNVFPQTIAVVKTKGKYLGIEVIVGDPAAFDFEKEAANLCGALFQNPDNFGVLHDFSAQFAKLKTNNVIAVLATDLLALTLVKTPKEMGADITVGNSQRFGVPMGYGGPHAAFFATIDEYKRKIPGRIIGVSVDRHQNRALRMAMQTREQHIRREKATSNICTAQALLANISAMYGIYHGPQGLTVIGKRVNRLAQSLAYYVDLFGYKVMEYSGDLECSFFDTISIKLENEQAANKIYQEFIKNKINLRRTTSTVISLSVDETTTLADIATLIKIFATLKSRQITTEEDSLFHDKNVRLRRIANEYLRKTSFMNQEIFNSIHSETQMQRFMHILQNKDISLTKSMISLGSCTMKLNAASEMYPISWPEFNSLHPFAPLEQTQGYQEMIKNLENWLRAVTKFDAFSLQPNSGAHGEYTGLLAIASYHQQRGHGHRNICLIPVSAHGTNPASAVLVGFKVVAVNSDAKGNIDLVDLQEKATKYRDNLAAFMVTYPSTHGVYEDTIKKSIDIIHEHGGQVYMDGANMNAQVGWTSPGFLGADVCHLNLHKTFAIPHGGGGPGLGPIGVRAHLAPFLPTHPLVDMKNNATHSPGTVTAAPWSSAGILPIPYAYIAQLGKEGLKKATAVAILNANYLCSRLKDHYKVLYFGQNDRVAHEFILDIRPIKEKCGISEEDIAKRLIDFGFHAPTMSFPVPGTLMIEPTESEDKGELDRFVEAFLKIREEIRNVENGVWDKLDNPLKNAPHTQDFVLATEWKHCYTRQEAAFPLPWVRSRGKFWPSVGRVDNAYGDRNLVCTCPPMTDYK